MGILPTKGKGQFGRRWIARVNQDSFSASANHVAVGPVESVRRWIHSQDVDYPRRQAFHSWLKWCNFADAFKACLSFGNDVSSGVTVGMWACGSGFQSASDGGGGGRRPL